MAMELHQVRYFLALARSLNFTRAAKECGVTQPSLTKAIRKLEYELGGELIYRERRLTQLTDLGKLVLPMLEATYAAAEMARRQAQEFRQKSIAPLRIGLTPCISASLIAQPLAHLSGALAGLQVELVECDPDHLCADLLEGAINAAVGGDDIHMQPERVDSWLLFEEDLVVLTALNAPLARSAAVPPDALSRAVWLEHAGSGAAKSYRQALSRAGMDVLIGHRSRQMDHLQHMAAAGLGILLAPAHLPRLASVTAQHIAGHPPRREVRLLAVAGRRYTPSLEAFIKMMRSWDWHVCPGAAADKRGAARASDGVCLLSAGQGLPNHRARTTP
jgi:DNA-binding transcriptional LysR family regulator